MGVRQKVIFSAFLAVTLLLSIALVSAAEIKPEEWAHPECIASVEELKSAIGNPDYIIIDASKTKPDKTVKGAIWISFKNLRQPNGLLKGIKCYPAKEGEFDSSELEKIFRQLGVSEGKTVIFVSSGDVTDAIVAWFALYFLGFDKAKVFPVKCTVLGDEYLAPVEKEWSSDWPETGTFKVDPTKIRWDMYATPDEVRAAMDDPSTAIVDVRPESYYKGEVSKTIRGGHLKTAINYVFSNFWEDGTKETSLKSKTALEAEVSKILPKDKIKKVITTCNTGHKAMSGFFFWQLGYKWEIDDASWNLHAFNGAMPAEDVKVQISYADYKSLKDKVESLKSELESLKSEVSKLKEKAAVKGAPGFTILSAIGAVALLLVLRRIVK